VAGVWSGWVDGAIESGRVAAAEVDALLTEQGFMA